MEVKKEERKNNLTSNLTLENRNKLQIDGVIEVIRFNDTEIFLNTELGTLLIKGEELKMNKLDVQKGDVIITGTINSCVYSSKEKSKNGNSVFSKLFK